MSASTEKPLETDIFLLCPVYVNAFDCFVLHPSVLLGVATLTDVPLALIWLLIGSAIGGD